jgi:ATP-dependent protease ClpP protease subunit
MNFQYVVDPLAKVPIMLLNDDIGYDPIANKGIDGAKFMSELMALDALKPERIEVWINSPGGVVMDGYNIYSAILKSNTKVDTVGVGCMASIAAVIFQAGRTRTMMDFSWLMYHNPHGTDDKKVIDTMTDSIGKMVARSGKNEADILQMMKKETYINAQEAFEYGLCDKIENSADHNKKRMLNIANTEAYWSEANKIVNKLIQKTSDMSLKLVTNKLGLNENASEDSILDAITKMENKAKSDFDSYELKVKDLQKQKDDLDDEINKIKAEKASIKEINDKANLELKAKTEALNQMTKEKEEAENAMLTEKCKNMVTEFAKVGRIKDDEKVINFWTELAKVDYQMVKDQIEAIPVNKKAPVINKIGGEKPAMTVGIAMAELAIKYNNKNN